MWSKKKSLYLTMIMTVMVAVMIVAAVICMPQLMKFYAAVIGIDAIPRTANGNFVFEMTLALYISALPGLVCTAALFKMLLNIRKNEVFVKQNVNILRLLSWCCLFVGVEYIIIGRHHISLVFLSFAALFFGLILRVIKNIFDKAVELREEADYTI